MEHDKARETRDRIADVLKKLNKAHEKYSTRDPSNRYTQRYYLIFFEENVECQMTFANK